MPWHVGRSDGCPDSKPYAVIKDDDGEVEGCHTSRAAAREQMAALYAQEGKTMRNDAFDQVQYKAVGLEVETTADLGEFDAIAAAYTVDRDGDRIVPGAFKGSIDAWQQSGKLVPLHWDHRSDPEYIIGVVDPKSMRERDDGLHVSGKLDLEGSEKAREAWRAMKNGGVSLSFGFLIEKQRKAADANEIVQVDLFEISLTPAPANATTRVLAMKSAKSEEQLKVESDRQRREAEQAERDRIRKDLPEPKEPEPVRTADDLFPSDEIEGARSFLKAVWTTAYINGLPDASFLYVASGGEKDEEGKTTPRSLRYFPYKDADGQVDLPHLRNALARIPQSNLSQSVKDQLVAKAQRILDNEKSVEDAKSEDPGRGKPAAQDPLRRRSLDTVLEVRSSGASLREPARVEKAEPTPASQRELRRRSEELALEVLIG